MSETLYKLLSRSGFECLRDGYKVVVRPRRDEACEPITFEESWDKLSVRVKPEEAVVICAMRAALR